MDKEYTITLPHEHTFTRSGVTFSIILAGLPEAIIAELVLHGITQKVGDAGSGHKGDHARGLMQKVADALEAGNWGAKREGGGRTSDPVMRAAMALATLEFDASERKKATIAAVVAKHGVTPAKARSMVLKAMAARPDTMDRARQQVADQNAAPDVDLTELGL